MGIPIVLLPPQRGRFDVVERCHVPPPLGFRGHFEELGELLDHRRDNPEERLVRRENGRASGPVRCKRVGECQEPTKETR